MAIRNDFTVDFTQDPRIITIAKPSTECSMQDLHDTLSHLQAQTNAIDESKLVDSSGKETLDSTNKVGITTTLQDAQVGFEARDGTEFGGVNEWTQCFFDGGNLVAVDTSTTPPTPIISTANNAFVNLTTTKSSSATLQEQDALQYASYGERVSVDLVLGLDGTAYPSGNMEFKVNNFTDAVSIAWTKGFNTLELRDDNDVDVGIDISKLKMRGISHLTSKLHVGFDAIANTCIFENLHLTGFLDGDSEVNNCIFEDILYFNGHIHGGGWAGRLILAGSLPAKIDNVSIASLSKPAILDCGGGGQDAIVNGFEGMVTVENLTNPATIAIAFKNGIVTLDNTCTDGVIMLSGNYVLTDNSGVGCTVISNGKVLIQEDISTIAVAVAEETLVKYQNKAVYIDTERVINGDGTATNPFNNVDDTTTFAEANGITIVYIYSDVVIDRNVKNFTCIGIGTPVVDCAGHDLKNTEFYGVELRGTYTDRIKAKECVLGNNFELNGSFKDCGVVGNITCIDGGVVTLHKCFANNSGATLSLNGVGSSTVSVTDFDNDLIIVDVNNILDEVSVSMKTNKLTLDATCVDGHITVSGQPFITDNSGVGCTVDVSAVNNKLAIADATFTKLDTTDI